MIWVVSAVIVLLLLNTKEFNRERKEIKRVVVKTFDPIVKLFKYLSNLPEEYWCNIAGFSVTFVLICIICIMVYNCFLGGGYEPC